LKKLGEGKPFLLMKYLNTTKPEYQIRLHPGIKKDLKGIPKNIYQKLSFVIKDLAVDPYIGYKLAGKYKSQMAFDFSYRYRIIYEINKNNKVLTVLEIWHRSRDYKK